MLSKDKTTQGNSNESEQFFHSLIDESEDGFELLEVLFNQAGNPFDYVFLYVNPLFERQTGLRKSDIVGKNASSILPNIESYWMETFDRVLKTGVSEHLENLSQYSKRWYACYVFRYKEQRVGILFRDITERKKAQEALKRSEARYRILVESPNSIVMAADKNLDITFMNKFGLDFFGYSSDEIIGKNVVGTTIPHFDDEGRDLSEMVHDIIANPEKYKTNVHKNMLKNGKLVWVSWTNSANYDSNGNLVEILAIGHDISALKNAEEKIRQYGSIQEGIKKIFQEALSTRNEQALGELCLSVAEQVTKSKFGFIGEINERGMQDIAISNPGWGACNVVTHKGHGKTIGNFKIHGLYGKVLREGKGYFTNDPSSHPERIGLPHGHPPITAFLGVPLIGEGKTIGMIAVGNREGGYSQNDLTNLEALAPAIVEAFSRKRAENALRINEQLYHTVFDNSEDGFQLDQVIFDRGGNAVDWVFLKVNEAFERQTDLKAMEVLGKRAKEVVPNIEEHFLVTLGRVAKTGKSEHVENYNRDTARWYDDYIFRFGDDQVGILFRDISERKKIEGALTRSGRRINEILESISDDFMVLDYNWNYVYANSQAAALVGLEPSEIVGKNFWHLFPQNIGTHIEKNLREAMEKREIRRFEIHGQYSLRYKLITTYPSADGIALIASDITDRKNLEKQLQENERLAAIGQTAGMVGHDIRNPLQAIVSELFLAKEALKEMPETERRLQMDESLQSIEESVFYINKIVSDLQDFTKSSKPTIQCVNMEELITSTIRAVNIPNNISISIVAHKNFFIESDESYLRRVIMNLAINGVQAMPRGGKLTVSAKKSDGFTEILVEDTGVGIPEEAKPNVFKPLFTTKAKGQGLGLAVVKKLVEALNGTISFESQEGKGTKFLIKLQ